jgi:hypothetical protein
LASHAKTMFLLLSLLLLVIYAGPRLMHLRDSRLLTTTVLLAYLPLYAVGLLLLVNTAHAGGRLVHEFGVHTILPSTPGQVQVPTADQDSLPDRGSEEECSRKGTGPPTRQ